MPVGLFDTQLAHAFLSADYSISFTRLVRESGCRYHVQHMSSGDSVEIVRRARREGGAGHLVTAEASPHHLVLTDEACEGYNTLATGLASFAMGYQSRATGSYSNAMGYLGNATGTGSVAIGYRSTADASYAIAIGQRASASPARCRAGFNRPARFSAMLETRRLWFTRWGYV